MAVTIRRKVAGLSTEGEIIPTVSGLPAMGLVKTGQTTAYNVAGRTSVTDGDSEIGLARSYTLLDTGQYSGTTTITVNSINDSHTNNCVIDHNTGLMWNAQNSPASYGAGTEGLLFDATGEAAGLDEEDIFYYCDQANTAGLSGYSDWRVPNAMEMLSILNYEASSAVPDPAYFTCDTSIAYQTSTSRPNSATTQHMSVSAASGTIQTSSKTTFHGHVLLVRG